MKKRVKNKQGISAVVATVLIILIVVAGIGIIWGAVIPLIKNNLDTQDFSVDLTIDTSQGYTVYDSESRNMTVQVRRGGSGENLVGLELVVSVGGNSEKFIFSEVPEKNGAKLYEFEVSGNPESVGVIAVFDDGKKSSILSEIKFIPEGDVVGVEGIAPNEEEEIEMDPYAITDCNILDEEGANYYITEDIIKTFDQDCLVINGNSITLDCQNHKIWSDDISVDQEIAGILVKAPSNNIHIHNCNISLKDPTGRLNSYYYGVNVESGTSYVSIEDNYFYDITGNGVNIVSSYSPKIKNNEFYQVGVGRDSGTSSIYLESSGTNSEIVENKIIDSYVYGVRFVNDLLWYTNISNNLILSSGGPGLDLPFYESGVVISNNVVCGGYDFYCTNDVDYAPIAIGNSCGTSNGCGDVCSTGCDL